MSMFSWQTAFERMLLSYPKSVNISGTVYPNFANSMNKRTANFKLEFVDLAFLFPVRELANVDVWDSIPGRHRK
jgi:hypothetical protein